MFWPVFSSSSSSSFSSYTIDIQIVNHVFITAITRFSKGDFSFIGHSSGSPTTHPSTNQSKTDCVPPQHYKQQHDVVQQRLIILSGFIWQLIMAFTEGQQWRVVESGDIFSSLIAGRISVYFQRRRTARAVGHSKSPFD